MKRIMNKLTSAIAVLTFVFALAAPATVGAASINDSLNKGTCLSTSDTNCDSGDADTKINDLIGKVIDIFTLVVGVTSVIMIILGGFKYITSGGDSGNVTGAKNTIMYAIIGLVVVALAQVIVRFVLKKATA